MKKFSLPVTSASLAAWCAPVLLAIVMTAGAQQVEEALNRIPDAPPGYRYTPLMETGRRYETAEGFAIEVRALGHGLQHPWGMAFLPNGDLLVSERNAARLQVIRDGRLLATPVTGLPEVRPGGFTGLLDVVLHPDFASNHWLYLTYNKPLDADTSAIAVARGTFDGAALHDVQDIFVADPGDGGASRLLFARDGMLYVSIYGAAEEVQDLSRFKGKVLRLTPDGGVPADNPFVNRADSKPQVFTYGHRTIQGLLQHPDTGDIWSLEMGPNGGDEVNLLKPGANYGWPQVSMGRKYPGPWQGRFHQDGMEDPIVYWMPSISVSGMTLYTGDRFPKWQGDLFVAGLRTGEIPGTGVLQRIKLNGLQQEIRRETLLADIHARVRGAHQGPDGLIYVLLDEDDGAVLQIRPAQ